MKMIKDFFLKISKKLFSHVGNKLMALAVILTMIGFIAFGIGLLVELLTFFDVFNGTLLLTTGVSALVTLLSSWPLYAFGQLVNDIHKISKVRFEVQTVVDAEELPEL